MNQITFVPVGGLANRMRSIASVITLAQQTKSYVKVSSINSIYPLVSDSRTL